MRSAARSTPGSSSCFPDPSEPTAVTCTPGFSHPFEEQRLAGGGARDHHVCTIHRLANRRGRVHVDGRMVRSEAVDASARMLRVPAPDPHLLESRPDHGQRLELSMRLRPRADHGDRLDTSRGEVSRRHPSRRARTHVGEVSVVQQEGCRRARPRIEHDHHAVGDRRAGRRRESARDLHGVERRPVDVSGLHVDLARRLGARPGGSRPGAPRPRSSTRRRLVRTHRCRTPCRARHARLLPAGSAPGHARRDDTPAPRRDQTAPVP
jgi:hypothetical protein